MKKYFSCTALLFLTGCALTPDAMRSDESALKSFNVAQGYQVVLKRLVDQNEKCRIAPLIPLGTVIYDVRNYPDLRVASIVAGASGFGTQIYMVIDLSEPKPGQTLVKVWSKTATEKVGIAAERVANGDLSCG